MGCKTTILAPSPYSTFSTFSIFHTSNPPSFGIKKIHDGWSRFPLFSFDPRSSSLRNCFPGSSPLSMRLHRFVHARLSSPFCTVGVRNTPLGATSHFVLLESWLRVLRAWVRVHSERIVIDLVFAWLNKFDTWMPLSFWYASTEVSAIYSSFYGSLDWEQRKLFDCRIVVHVPWDFSIF